MGVILESKPVMTDILRVISRFCHCPEGQQLYGVELRLVLGCSKKSVKLPGNLLARACRTESVSEITDK